MNFQPAPLTQSPSIFILVPAHLPPLKVTPSILDEVRAFNVYKAFILKSTDPDLRYVIGRTYK